MRYFKNLINAALGRSFNLSTMNGAEIEEFLRLSGGNQSISGVSINASSVMGVTTAWRCINLISNAVANMPRDLIETTDDGMRRSAIGHPLRNLIRVRPNNRQTPKEFIAMQQAWMLLRGNCYALKVEGFRGKIVALLPLAAPAVEVIERPDGEVLYEYTRKDGSKIIYPRDKILHIKGLSLDGVTGLSAIAYARETFALSIDSQVAASTLMKNGSFVDGVITVPEKFSPEAYKRLKDSWDSNRTGVDNAGKTPILEEGAKLDKLSMTASDLQFLESRTWQKYDIAELFGVPGPMIGLTEKTTSWGTGIEQITIGFVNYTLNDHLISWQESLNRDCLSASESESYSVKFNVNGLLKGDTKTRWDSYTKARQWGIMNSNEIRALEDLNPRTDPGGDEYAVPPNQTKDDEPGDTPKEETDD